jgi:hypothetical protein
MEDDINMQYLLKVVKPVEKVKIRIEDIDHIIFSEKV